MKSNLPKHGALTMRCRGQMRMVSMSYWNFVSNCVAVVFLPLCEYIMVIETLSHPPRSVDVYLYFINKICL